MLENNIFAGAKNLLVNCSALNSGDKVLILHENPSLGWYDFKAPITVAKAAEQLGIQASLQQVDGPCNQPNSDILEAWNHYDTVICFARIGDQNRFSKALANKKLIMCYVRDADMLASKFGSINHRALTEFKLAINELLLGSKWITIRCPLGTELTGQLSPQTSKREQDVSILRFPMAVPQPVRAMNFSGKVALSGYLTSTGSKVYSPATLKIEKTVFAVIEHGRIKRFEGAAQVTAKVQAHYQRIAQQFNIDADVVHSWHAGIHPGCSYSWDIESNPDLWSNSVFANPRYLHFHTCGDYAPGEISWMVLDPTISIDSKKLWDNGRLKAEDFETSRTCLNKWPELAEIFAHPSDTIGF